MNEKPKKREGVGYIGAYIPEDLVAYIDETGRIENRDRTKQLIQLLGEARQVRLNIQRHREMFGIRDGDLPNLPPSVGG